MAGPIPERVTRDVFSKRKVHPNERLGHPKTADLERQKYLHERRQRALDLRVAGFNLQQIVDADIGYNNVSAVQSDLSRSYHKLWIEDPSELIMLDLQRLDEMQRLCTLALRQGNTGEADRLMRIMGFRHGLLGISPERIQDEVLNQKRISDSGILVIQGTAQGSEHEYVKRMMLASGMSEDAADREILKLESKGVDTHVQPPVPQPVERAIAGARSLAAGKKSVRLKLTKEALQRSLAEEVEEFPLPEYAPDPMPADIRQPVVNVVDTGKLINERREGEDIRDTVRRVIHGDAQSSDPQEPGTDPPKKKLKIRINTEGLANTNQYPGPGVPYREPPRKTPVSHPKAIYDTVGVEVREEPF